MKKAFVWFLLWFCPAVIVAGVLYLNVIAALEWRLADRLNKGGQQVEAQLVDRFETQSLKTTSSYMATYRFRLPNDPISYQQTRPMDEYNWSRKAGGGLDTVTVTYLPADPTVSDITGNEVMRGRIAFALFANLVLALAIWAVRRAARQQATA